MASTALPLRPVSPDAFDVAAAIRGERLAVFVQQIVPLHDGGRFAGRAGVRNWQEALLRLRGPDGPLPPAQLIAAAEERGMMELVDRQMIHMVLKILGRLGSGPLAPELLSINISGPSLCDLSLARYLRRELQESGADAERICFEITETAAIRDLERAQDTVVELRRLGCRIALDDFGTGRSSLAYLKSFQADYLKIDGQFVRNMVNDAFDCAAVEAVTRLAHLKGMGVVAEFVENQQTCERLRELGVDYAQGYLFHKPEAWPLVPAPATWHPICAGA